jgi:tRNA1Val (adenine37-N6)-methyltransferase
MSNNFFHFQKFSLKNESAAFKINTDGVLLAAWAEMNSANQILDIGTGTAVIAHICAQRNPKSFITGIDIDIDSYEEAKFNVVHNNLEHRISIVHGDVVVWESPHLYDHVITNPPYFSDSTLSTNKKLNIAKHTEHLSIEKLWSAISRLTHTTSKVSLILPFDSKDKCIQQAAIHRFHVARQLNIKNRSEGKYIRIALEFSREVIEKEVGELCIHSDGEAYYSDAFINLHKDLNMIFKDHMENN